MKKKILLAPYIQSNKNNEQFFTFSYSLIKYLNKLNFKIFFYSKLDTKLKEFDALILPGSGDIFKISGLQEDKKREDIERKLLKYFISKKKPILTICRGSLFICSINNSKIIKIRNHVKKNHNVYLKKKTINVNSYHNYQIKNKPKGFKIIGRTNDGCIEIINNKSKNILSLMFHPERKNKSQKFINQQIKNFFNGINNISSW